MKYNKLVVTVVQEGKGNEVRTRLLASFVNPAPYISARSGVRRRTAGGDAARAGDMV